MAFPINPVLLDQHTIGTQIYQWNGVAWDIAIATTPGTIEAELNALVSEAVASTSETNAAASELASSTSETNAAASAAAALSSENSTAADAVQTNLDVTQTVLDAAATAADRVQTGLDETQTGLDRIQTVADATQTALDRIQTSADRVQTISDAASTALDRTDVNAVEGRVAAIEVSINSTFDTFDDRFLGTFTTDPTLDNDGNPISVGAVYYNSVGLATKFYNGSTWDDPSQSASTSATSALNSENAAALSETNAAASAVEAADLLPSVYNKTESDSLYDPIGASVAMAIALGG